MLWAFVLAAARWTVRPKGRRAWPARCTKYGRRQRPGRLFALEFARRRALLVLWDINTQSNEETAGMVRHIYRDLEAADAAARCKVTPDRRPRRPCLGQASSQPRALPLGRRNPRSQPVLLPRKSTTPAAQASASGICPLIRGMGPSVSEGRKCAKARS